MKSDLEKPPLYQTRGEGLELLSEELLAAGLTPTAGHEEPYDLLWSGPWPFDELSPQNLAMGQRVNHFPSAPFTSKAWLAQQNFDFIPQAIAMPAGYESFVETYALQDSNLWVRKHSTHRGVKLTSPLDALHHMLQASEPFFVQKLVHPPHRIFGHKWDFGIFVAITQLQPLNVFAYEDVVFRLCPKRYPDEPETAPTSTYVIDDRYLPPWELDTLEALRPTGGTSNELLQAYIGANSPGKDWSSQLRERCHAAIYRTIENSCGEMLAACDPFIDGQDHFFELYRFDFLFDEELTPWLMEVNLSPNLSAAAHPRLADLFGCLSRDVLRLLGYGSGKCQHWVALASRDVETVKAATTSPGKPARAPTLTDGEELHLAAFGLAFSITLPKSSPTEVITSQLPSQWQIVTTRSAESTRYCLDESGDLFIDGQLQKRCKDQETAIRSLIADLHLQAALRATSALFLRASAVELNGQTILIVGSPQSGRSTLALTLLAEGAKYISDSFVVIDLDGRIEPYPIDLCLHMGEDDTRYITPSKLSFSIASAAHYAHRVIDTAYKPETAWAPKAIKGGAVIETMLPHCASVSLTRAELKTWLKQAFGETLCLSGPRGEANEIAATLNGS
ncbi:MAG: hypothetical protein AAGI11_07005 [Pseudomonadota bacterium]